MYVFNVNFGAHKRQWIYDLFIYLIFRLVTLDHFITNSLHVIASLTWLDHKLACWLHLIAILFAVLINQSYFEDCQSLCVVTDLLLICKATNSRLITHGSAVASNHCFPKCDCSIKKKGFSGCTWLTQKKHCQQRVQCVSRRQMKAPCDLVLYKYTEFKLNWTDIKVWTFWSINQTWNSQQNKYEKQELMFLA